MMLDPKLLLPLLAGLMLGVVFFGGLWWTVQRAVTARWGPLWFFASLSVPDLLIRTGGERRISNFLLWDLAYTELHFTDTLWPAFNAEELAAVLDLFSHRQRRFGGVPEQLEAIGD